MATIFFPPKSGYTRPLKLYKLEKEAAEQGILAFQFSAFIFFQTTAAL